jgi:pimeloyl-ACP methyl ester carboxylesterase
MPQPHLLLHGALGSGAQVQPLADLLTDQRPVLVFTFPGHGGDDVPTDGYRMRDLADALSHFLREEVDGPVEIFGYSMGGYVAAMVATELPERISGITTLGTKWAWSPEIARREVAMLDPDIIREKVPALAQLISDRHQPQPWESIVRATAAMMLKLGEAPPLLPERMADVAIPVTILRGGADRMVSADESHAAAKAFARGQYHELPDQKHPLEQVDLHQLLPWLHGL